MNEDLPEQDPLGDQLRREAEAERPSFSLRLHARIVQGIREEQSVIDSSRALRWISRLAVAAAIVAVLGLTALVVMRSSHAPAPTPQVAVVSPQTVESMPSIWPTTILPPSALTVDIGGIFSAKFSPAGITMGLSSVHSTPVEPARSTPKANPGSPDWLLAKLQEPTSSAAEALAELLPPETRLLPKL